MSTEQKKDLTLYERCQRRARNGHGCTTEEEVTRVANHLYMRELSGGKEVGRVDGKLVFDKPETVKPKLPA